MNGFTKLFGSIVNSTIWREPNEVRIVWITMLALCDRDGVVESSLPGLADASRVTIEECVEALRVLSSPDPYSRTKDNEGRRIREVDGGWLILNHAKYRAKMSVEEMREKARIRQERWRKNKTIREQVKKQVKEDKLVKQDAKELRRIKSNGSSKTSREYDLDADAGNLEAAGAEAAGNGCNHPAGSENLSREGVGLPNSTET